MHFYGDIALRGERSDEITLQEAWVDEHFESQILRLSGATKDGTPVPARLWTSSLLRTRQTARHIPHPTVPYTTAEGTHCPYSCLQSVDAGLARRPRDS